MTIGVHEECRRRKRHQREVEQDYCKKSYKQVMLIMHLAHCARRLQYTRYVSRYATNKQCVLSADIIMYIIKVFDPSHRTGNRKRPAIELAATI